VLFGKTHHTQPYRSIFFEPRSNDSIFFARSLNVYIYGFRFHCPRQRRTLVFVGDFLLCYRDYSRTATHDSVTFFTNMDNGTKPKEF